MGIALLPLAVLSYVQTVAITEVAESRARAAILGETLAAATPLVNIILQAQGTANTLAASMPSHLDDLPACKETVSRVMHRSGGRYSFVGFVPLKGPLLCTSTEVPKDMDLSPWLREHLLDPRPQLTVARQAQISKTSVLNLSVPVQTTGAGLIGFLSISMPHAVLETMTAHQPDTTASPLALMIFDKSGTLLAASTELDAAPPLLPRSQPMRAFAERQGESFLDETNEGKRRAFAVVPLSPGGLFLLGSWPAERLADEGFGIGLPAVTFPLLMWGASLLAAYLAAQSQVLRHIGALRDSIMAFAEGDRSLTPPALAGAALELRDVGDAYEKMTTAIVYNEADLENMVHQKEVLLREVHHRVKNNLQLIASILNMQSREARSDEARAAIQSVQDRVIGLATIHRELYQIPDLSNMRAAELLPHILHHSLKIGAAPGRKFDITIAIDEAIRIAPDQAVPLALFLTEGTTNVLKHAAGGAGNACYIKLQLNREGAGRAVLRLENSLGRSASEPDAPSPLPLSDGFGSKLLTAFAHQLDGTMTRQRRSRSYVLSLDFPLYPQVRSKAPPVAP